MNVKQLKEIIKDLPDDTKIQCEYWVDNPDPESFDGGWNDEKDIYSHDLVISGKKYTLILK